MVKLKVFLSIVALAFGLAVPHLQILYRVIIILSFFVIDAIVKNQTQKREFSVSLFFVTGLILSYLYKLIFL